VILKDVDEWGAPDTGATARRAVDACRGLGFVDLQYDCIGVGAGVKSEANRLATEKLMPRGLRLTPWNAGADTLNPDGYVVEHDRQSPKNRDFYTNLKAQAWWNLRRRFERTWRAVNEPGYTWKADDLISLPSTLKHLRSLQRELSQPTASQGSRMKLLIDKQPEGTKSPNLADAVVMAFFPVSHAPLAISNDVLREAQRARR
jgi:phage terminase large subunit